MKPVSFMRLKKVADESAILKKYAPKDLVVQQKIDGWKLFASKQKGKVKLYTRRGVDVTESLPSVAARMDKLLPDGTSVLGELSYLIKGKQVITAAQAIISAKPQKAIERTESQDGKLAYYVYDILENRGKRVTSEPFKKRDEMVRALIPSRGLVQTLKNYRWSQRELAFKAADKAGGEGIVVKPLDSKYVYKKKGAGEPAGESFKLKRGKKAQLAAVVLKSYKKGKERLIFPAYQLKNGKYFEVGKVSGLPKKIEKQVKKDIDAGKKVVAEVSFQERMPSGKLRHMGWKRLRPDKPLKSTTMNPTEFGIIRTETKDIEDVRDGFKPLAYVWHPEHDIENFYYESPENAKYAMNMIEDIRRAGGGWGWSLKGKRAREFEERRKREGRPIELRHIIIWAPNKKRWAEAFQYMGKLAEDDLYPPGFEGKSGYGAFIANRLLGYSMSRWELDLPEKQKALEVLSEWGFPDVAQELSTMINPKERKTGRTKVKNSKNRKRNAAPKQFGPEDFYRFDGGQFFFTEDFAKLLGTICRVPEFQKWVSGYPESRFVTADVQMVSHFGMERYATPLDHCESMIVSAQSGLPIDGEDIERLRRLLTNFFYHFQASHGWMGPIQKRSIKNTEIALDILESMARMMPMQTPLQNPRRSKVKDALAAEAVRHKDFDDFAKRYWLDCARGIYWYATNDEVFRISNREIELAAAKRFVVACNPEFALMGPNKDKKFVAELNVNALTEKDFEVIRGADGAKIRIISNLDRVKVTRVMEQEKAKRSWKYQQSLLPSSKEQLKAFYKEALKAEKKRQLKEAEKAEREKRRREREARKKAKKKAKKKGRKRNPWPSTKKAEPVDIPKVRDGYEISEMIDYVIEDVADPYGGEPQEPTRSNVARELKLFRERVREAGGYETPDQVVFHDMYIEAVTKFDKLPLEDRLRIIDEGLARHRAKKNPEEAAEAIARGFGVPESAHGFLGSIHEFKEESRRRRKKEEEEARRARLAAKRRPNPVALINSLIVNAQEKNPAVVPGIREIPEHVNIPKC